MPSARGSHRCSLGLPPGWSCRLCGGRDARIVVVPTASSLADTGERYDLVVVGAGIGLALTTSEAARRFDELLVWAREHEGGSELREEADEFGPFLVDVAHWASEWPWLAGVANRLGGQPAIGMGFS